MSNKISAAHTSLNLKGSTEAMEDIDTSSCWQVTSDVSLRQAQKISLFMNKPWQKSVKSPNITPTYRFVAKVKVKFTLEQATNAQGGVEV